MREFADTDFDKALAVPATDMLWPEELRYYPRYRPRYLVRLRQLTVLLSEDGLDILKIGGGQLAYLFTRQWQQDRACVAGVNDKCFPSLKQSAIDTVLLP